MGALMLKGRRTDIINWCMCREAGQSIQVFTTIRTDHGVCHKNKGTKHVGDIPTDWEDRTLKANSVTLF